ncbi:MAG: hypothetical protein JNK82_28710 [Myxococcaceae bacterium]|nr:hypothetical protein [Myxococcaceae bacterium]
MSHARTRFFALIGLFIWLFSAGEGLARRGGGRLRDAGHRVSFKLALLEAKGGAPVVVLGSSRGNDCVQASAIDPHGVSLTTPSSSLPTLEHVATKAALAPGLKLALVELSRRQAADDLPDVAAPAPQVDAEEDPAGAWLTQHSALLQARGAFAPENWARLAGLVVPEAFDGSEYFRSRWFVETFARVPEPAPGELDLFVRDTAGPAPQAGPEWERISSGYARVADAFRARGVKVVLYATPTLGALREEECDAASRVFRASVAAHVGAPLLDFTCSAAPREWLADTEGHCGSLGRARFSQKLSQELRALP